MPTPWPPQHSQPTRPEKAALAVAILRPSGGERILDLACGAGGRLLELCRRGFDVVGSDVDSHLVETACGEAELAGLGPLPFQCRVYSLAELEQVLDRAGLTLAGVHDEQGAERPPSAEQHEIYVVAQRPE